MDRIKPKQPHILFLFSDTGGGHRSVAEAIIEAIHRYFPDRFSTEMVDFFKEYAPPPFNLAPEIYPPMTSMPELWGFGYRISNGQRRTRIFYNLMWPFLRRRSARLQNEHAYDLLVSVHPVPVIPYSRSLQPGSPPFITVITDLVSTHAFWFDHRSDLVLVPTEIARRCGLAYGLRPKQILFRFASRSTLLPTGQDRVSSAQGLDGPWPYFFFFIFFFFLFFFFFSFLYFFFFFYRDLVDAVGRNGANR
jgi:1,2-diacylglycerol 3-beta-galactosyltransferase